MKRQTRLKIYDCIYREVGARGDACTYCGQISDTYDHIPPICMAGRGASCGVEDAGPFIKVPACLECNSTLGSSGLLSIEKRRAYIKGRLRKKYKHFLRIPNWDEDELGELSPEFARDVRASVKFANAVRMRLAWRR